MKSVMTFSEFLTESSTIEANIEFIENQDARELRLIKKEFIHKGTAQLEGLHGFSEEDAIFELKALTEPRNFDKFVQEYIHSYQKRGSLSNEFYVLDFSRKGSKVQLTRKERIEIQSDLGLELSNSISYVRKNS